MKTRRMMKRAAAILLTAAMCMTMSTGAASAWTSSPADDLSDA
ncbi:MAG: hypothetical protein ACI4LM_00180 [Anaerovoracaceae bacterium]